jgi:2-methylcitrate dehydratase PrpD
MMTGSLTGWTAGFLADYRERELDEQTWEQAKRCVLDSLVAVVSGAALKPGRLAQQYVAERAGPGRSHVAGSGVRTCPELAAFANGMCAHSDETDDANEPARIHPGASIVPAALAAAEHAGVAGERLLRAVSAGYDLGVGVVMAAWEPGKKLRQSVQSTHGIGQLFGAMGAAAVVSELPPGQLRYVLSYTSQMAAGLSSFFRDSEHIEKAFAMGGKQAQDGVRAVEYVKAGFTGVDDIFDGTPGFFDAFGVDGDPGSLPRTVDQRHVLTSDMKQFPIGYPIQAAAQALIEILREHPLEDGEVASVEARLPAEKAWIVDGRHMPSIHLQYVLTVLLEDGKLTFDNTHDYVRHDDPRMRRSMERVTLIHDPELDPPPTGEGGMTRKAVVSVTTTGGETFSARVDPVRGSRLDPLSWEEIEEKAHNVLSSVQSEQRTSELIETVRRLDELEDVSSLGRLLTLQPAL